MLLATLIIIFGMYLFFALLQVSMRKRFSMKVCAICAAVLLTWVGLFAYWYLNGKVDAVLIALLVGQSITGTMYLFDNWARRNMKEIIPLKIIIILLGTAVAYSVLGDVHEPHEHIKLFLFFVVVLALVVGYFIFTTESERKGKRSVLEKQLEDCC